MLVLGSLGPGCGSADHAAATAADAFSARVRECLEAVSAEPVEVTVMTESGRLRLQRARGLTLVEEHCVRGSLAVQELPSSMRSHTYRFRMRYSRSPDPHPVRAFVFARRAALLACRPCALTRIVATPIGTHYALSAELVGDEPLLEPGEQACIRAALEGLPAAEPGDTREVVAILRDDSPACVPAQR